jgi:hypothetical protein
MTETKGDVQHHIGYAYHKLNDRRLMWIEYLEEKIEACQQRIQDSGKPVCAGRRVARETQEETETEALEPATTATEAESEREDETETTDLDTREEAVETSEEEATEELW